ncbi:MAG: C40 family peptidase [Treponema sp.]|nr:C40 family peptidase [Treponema sp.]
MKKLLLVVSFLFFGIMALSAQTNAQKRQKFIEAAKTYLGVPYVYGGSTRSGIDCSGFIMCAYRDAGLGSLPHSAKSMYSQSTKITAAEREVGDLCFFADSSGISHVSIYIGNNQVIHAISDGPRTGVVISSLNENYWKNHYHSSGRIIGSANGAVINTTTPSTTNKPSSNKTSSKRSSKKRRYTNFSFDTSILADFDFLTTDAEHFNFHMNGGTIQTDLLFTMFDIKPGIMARYTYMHPQNTTEFSADALFNNFRVPVCAEIFIGDYFGIYTGIVLGPQLNISEPVLYGYNGTEKQLQTPLYPGIFGITAKTPDINIGNVGVSVAADISFTNYTAAPEEETLTFQEWLAAGLSFSAGLRFRLPF